MRFIIQDDVHEQLPPNWDKEVLKAEEYVESNVIEAKVEAEAKGITGVELDDICLKARHSAINTKSAVWRAAYEALSSASHGKCWYCESKQDRSDKPVDHFRPKNSVAEDSTHPGYTWLAFDWRNFRLSCTFCNSKRRDKDTGQIGGKQNHFPIIPPPSHSRSLAATPDRPKLLDPVNDDDTKLLTFHWNGFPSPVNNNVLVVDRVEASIELYNLKQTSLVRRRKQLAAEINEHVSLGDEAERTNNTTNFRFCKKEIIKKVRAQAELSAAARIYLGAYRDRTWVAEIFSRDL